MRTPVLAAVLALTAVPALAQDTADSRRPPLFVLHDDDSRVYLLGSIHLLPEDALPLPAAVEAAYAGADVVAFELDLDIATAEAPEMMQAGMDEATVAQALSPTQKAAFDAALADLGLPAGALDAFEPWLAGLTLGVLAAHQTGAVPEGSVDAHFFTRAKDDGKERVAFETVGLQTAVFDDLTTADQVAFLMATVEGGVDEMAAAFDRMYAAWSTGDDAALAAIVTDGLDATPAVAQALLTDRNRAWVPQVEALLAREGQDVLVVVGAGHLIGPDSVVAMLRAAGYTVERL